MRMMGELLTFLLNACWQIALLTVVSIGCARLLRAAPVGFRHWLWVGALVMSFCLPVLSTSISGERILNPLRLQTANQAAAIPAASLSSQASAVQDQPNQVTIPKNAYSSIEIDRRLGALMVLSYALFLLYRGIRFLRAWERTKAIANSAYPCAFPEHLQTTMAQCHKAFGDKRVSVSCSASLPIPITFGSLNPVVILPERLLHEDTDVLKSAVGHELAHVQRRDYLLNLIYELMYLPISFHPAAVLLRRKINQTRELCCDELVAERLLEPQAYARSLIQLAGSAPALGRLAATTTLGIADADILEVRVMTLLRRPKLTERRKKLLLLAVSLMLAIPCVAAASFAMPFGIDQENASQDSTQEAKEKRAKEERKKQEMEERERAEREAKTEFTGPEDEGRRHREQELKEMSIKVREESESIFGVRRGAGIEAANWVKITMDQAIQIATNQHPGTVVECNLIGEREDQVAYRIIIVNGDESKRTVTVTFVLVSALDGRIIKTEQKEGRKKEGIRER